MSSVFILVLILSSCNGKQSEQSTKEHHDEAENIVELTNAQYNNAEIEMGEIEMRTISGTIPASGILDVPPQSKVSISAPMGGFVKSTELLQGSRVEKGQVVAVMQHQDYIQLQQDYLEHFSQLEFLKLEYERQEELSKESVNSRKSLEQARANFNSTNATVAGLKAKLQMININIKNLEKGKIQNTINLYSPISGYVTKVNTNIGAFVNPTDVLLEIVNTKELHVELTIFEKDVPLLKVNQHVLFTLANESMQRVAKIHLIGREISEDRNVQVHCHIEKQDRELIPGMYLKAIIETDSAHVTAVPEEAVVNFRGKNFIFIETKDSFSNEKNGHKKGNGNHHFKMIEVITGEAELGFIAITLPQGVGLNTKIVTKGSFNILAKMKNSEGEGHVH